MDPPLPAAIMCGTATFAVCHTPVRLMSIMSAQLCSVMSVVLASVLAIPAFADTMSSRPPSSATPCSTTACRAARSRTSACRATMRRSRASTSLTVCARSSGVAIGYGTLSTCAHRSTAMMSAPSSASRTAWLRPCPRAAPVMNATLPSTRPMACPLGVVDVASTPTLWHSVPEVEGLRPTHSQPFSSATRAASTRVRAPVLPIAEDR